MAYKLLTLPSLPKRLYILRFSASKTYRILGFRSFMELVWDGTGGDGMGRDGTGRDGMGWDGSFMELVWGGTGRDGFSIFFFDSCIEKKHVTL